jgi:hypothetical protein
MPAKVNVPLMTDAPAFKVARSGPPAQHVGNHKWGGFRPGRGMIMFEKIAAGPMIP